MPKSRELIFENAPLTEVIAELHWRLTPLQIMPGSAIDPFYTLLEDRLTANLAKNGFSHVEFRVPPNVPREVLAHNVVRLFREAPSQWPVYQVGPGVFTANVTPPYGGWSNFKPFVAKGLEYLTDAYPDTAFLKPERAILRYVNAFGKTHGLQNRYEFVTKYLGFDVRWPKGMMDIAPDEQNIGFTGDLRVPIKQLPGANAFVNWTEGNTQDGEPIIVLNIAVHAPLNDRVEIDEWVATFDTAHTIISGWFEAMVRSKIRAYLGEEIAVK